LETPRRLALWHKQAGSIRDEHLTEARVKDVQVRHRYHQGDPSNFKHCGAFVQCGQGGAVASAARSSPAHAGGHLVLATEQAILERPECRHGTTSRNRRRSDNRRREQGCTSTAMTATVIDRQGRVGIKSFCMCQNKYISFDYFIIILSN
jgi:hypothetical protein